jgi:hypothetical protein
MRFRTVAVLALVAIPVPTALMLSRFMPRAHARVAAGAQQMAAADGQQQEAVWETPPAIARAAPMTRAGAGWNVTWPAEGVMNTGQFEVVGTLEINPSSRRKPKQIAVSVIVEDAMTGQVVDERDHGTFVADPAQEYRISVAEQFNLPPGTWMVRFQSFYVSANGRAKGPGCGGTAFVKQ